MVGGYCAALHTTTIVGDLAGGGIPLWGNTSSANGFEGNGKTSQSFTTSAYAEGFRSAADAVGATPVVEVVSPSTLALPGHSPVRPVSRAELVGAGGLHLA